jgi:hypothetical protein
LQAVCAKVQKLVKEVKQEMLKRIAIETGKQIDQISLPSKRQQICIQNKIEKDFCRKEINNMPMQKVISGGYWQVIFKRIQGPGKQMKPL